MKKAKLKILKYNLFITLFLLCLLTFMRFEFNDQFAPIFFLGLLVVGLYTLYGLLANPRYPNYFKFGIYFNLYALAIVVLSGLYYLSIIPNSIDIALLISIALIGIPISGVVALSILFVELRNVKKSQ
jgi:hypothetical protein